MQILENYGRLPLSFEANQGQTDSQVKFLSRGPGYNLFLTLTGGVISLKDKVVKMELVGANQAPLVTGVDELEGKANYFIGDNPTKWQTNVSTYSKVEYQDVYPGINLIYYGNQQQLEYDFVVAPGADPQIILLDFEGAGRIESDVKGNIVLSLAGEQITLQKPFIYQEIGDVRKEIAGGYAFKDERQIGFQIDEYDLTRPLIIDPILLIYSTYLGGSGQEAGESDIAVDNTGSVYLTSTTNSTDFPTVNPIQSNYGGGTWDVYVTKIDPTGSALVYSTYLGGNDVDTGKGIAADGYGNVYVTGFTASSNFPTANAVQPTKDCRGDAFVTKLDPTGSALVYSSCLGGSSADTGMAIALDINNNVYLTGRTKSFDFPTVNALQPEFHGGSSDVFVIKLNNAGSAFIYSTYLGGGGQDMGWGITTDSVGNAYVTGTTQTRSGLPPTVNDFPVANAFQPLYGGVQDAFVTKLGPTGSSFVYSTYLGGSDYDGGFGIAVDAGNNVHLTGFTYSLDFPTTNAIQTAYGGGTGDAFVTKMNSLGSALVYSTYLGGVYQEMGSSIALDSSGNAYVAGNTMPDTVFPRDRIGPVGVTISVLVAKLNSSGTILFNSSAIGGSSFDLAWGIGVDADGNAYVAGTTESIDFPTASPVQPTYGGGAADAFVLKLFAPPNQPPTVSSGGPHQVNEGSSVQVSATGNDPENGALTYAWDLDNNGSFETPGQSVAFSAATLDGPSSHTIAVQVTDDDGLTATDSATVDVFNVAPTVGAITAPLDPVLVNTQVNTSVSFTDPGIPDTHTAIWEWGDTLSSPGTVDQVNDTVTGSHTYTTPGVYEVKVIVTDDDLDSDDSIYQFIVVYDSAASGGFVTGAGVISSPAGAYTANPSLTGIARFGFVSKYRPGATDPTGTTQFRFQTAQFSFTSSDYQWLVVAGPQAKFKGTGTVNGSGNYGFQLSGTDGAINGGGGVDKFRIKIWDKNNNDEVVYDNELGAGDDEDPTTAITGGNIVIH